MKAQVVPYLLAIALASTFSVALAQSPARDKDIALMLAYPLSQIGEPEIWKNCGDNDASYRFTTIIPNRRVDTVRLSRDFERATAEYAILDLPGTPDRHHRRVSEAQWVILEELIGKTDFWELPTEVSVWKLESHDYNFYLEGCRNGQYHAIRRDPTHFDDVKELVLFFVSILQSFE